MSLIALTHLHIDHSVDIPAIAYAIEIKGKKIVFAGDTSADTDHLIQLAKDADYLIT